MHDQEFQPNKKPRTLNRMHDKLVRSRDAAACKGSSIGKENQAPPHIYTESCLQPDKQQDLLSDCETLPLRQAGPLLSSASKPTAIPHLSVTSVCQAQGTGTSRLSVRSFFTKSRSKSSWSQHDLHSSASGDTSPGYAKEQIQLSFVNNLSATTAPLSYSSCQPDLDSSCIPHTEQSASQPSQKSQAPAAAGKQLSASSGANIAATCTGAPSQATQHSHPLSSVSQAASSISYQGPMSLMPKLITACAAGSAGTADPIGPAGTACAAGPTGPVPSPLPGDFIVLDASDSDEEASDDGKLANLQTQAVQSEKAVLAWLHQNGLSTYAAAFSQAEVDLELIPCLTDSDLKQMGVTALGPRRKILAAASKLSVQPDLDDISIQGAVSKSVSGEASVALKPCGQDAFALLMQQARQGQSKACTASAVPEKAAAPTDALTLLMQQARAGHAGTAPAASISSTRGHRAGHGPARSGPLRLPDWQLVPGTRFVVDKFGGRAYEAAPNTKHWFLTHFHADHYGGLGPRFKQGTIYCSPITARLVHQRLKVPLGRLQVVPLHSPTEVAGVTITFVDAHHCPGAVMVLFEAPGKLPLLHTGDCRCHTGMQAEECLQRVRSSVDLVLDTTYCQPQYVFPKQEEVLSFVLDAVRAEAFNEMRTLFLFGSYTIGKEKLFLEVARTLNQKMYVSVAKRKVLECLELPAATAALLTSNDKETNLHAVPLWSVTLKSMARLLKHYRGHYTTVVGFQPTGWTQKQDRGRTGQGRRRQKGTLITYQVPYSEHSSFPEMKEFVSWLRPRRIIPSVGNDMHGPKAAQMVALLR